MKESNQDILAVTEAYIKDFFQENIGGEYVFHDLQHVKNVVEAVRLLGASMNLTDRQLELLQLAAWFHDTGYIEGAEGHEERSCKFAVTFLSKYDFPRTGPRCNNPLHHGYKIAFQTERSFGRNHV